MIDSTRHQQQLQTLLHRLRHDDDPASTTTASHLAQIHNFVATEDVSDDDVASDLSDAAETYFNQARHNIALPLLQSALTVYRRVHSADQEQDHWEIAATLTNIGHSLVHLGQTEQGALMLEESHEMRKRMFGPDADHPDIATAINDRGWALEQLGQRREALRLAHAALSMRQRLQSRETAATVGQQQQLQQQRQQQFHPYHRGGGGGFDVATSMQNVAMMLVDLERPQEAVTLLHNVLRIQRQTLLLVSSQHHRPNQEGGEEGEEEEDHPEIARTMSYIGGVLASAGQLEDGMSLQKQALAMQRRVYRGEDHVDLANTMIGLSRSHSQIDQHRERLDLSLKAYEMLRRLDKKYAGGNISFLSAMMNIGHCLTERGYCDDALTIHKEALSRCRRLFGCDADHLMISHCLDGIGSALLELQHVHEHEQEALERKQEALRNYWEALCMRQRLFSKRQEHPKNLLLAMSMQNYGAALYELGQYQEALKWFEGALEMRKAVLKNEDAESIVRSFSSIREVLTHLGRTEEAEALWAQQGAPMRKRLDERNQGVKRRIEDMSALLDAQPLLLDTTITTTNNIDLDAIVRELSSSPCHCCAQRQHPTPSETATTTAAGAPSSSSSANTQPIPDQLTTRLCFLFGVVRAALHLWHQHVPKARLRNLAGCVVEMIKQFPGCTRLGGDPLMVLDRLGRPAAATTTRCQQTKEGARRGGTGGTPPLDLGEDYTLLPRIYYRAHIEPNQLEPSPQQQEQQQQSEDPLRQLKDMNADLVLCFSLPPQRWEKYVAFFTNTTTKRGVLSLNDLQLSADDDFYNVVRYSVDECGNTCYVPEDSEPVRHVVTVDMSASRIGEYLVLKESQGTDFGDEGWCKIRDLHVFSAIEYKKCSVVRRSGGGAGADGGKVEVEVEHENGEDPELHSGALLIMLGVDPDDAAASRATIERAQEAAAAASSNIVTSSSSSSDTIASDAMAATTQSQNAVGGRTVASSSVVSGATSNLSYQGDPPQDEK